MTEQKQLGNRNPLEEYKDLSANMRQYASMRFAQLTLFIAMTAGLFNLLFGSNSTISGLPRDIFKSVGILIAIAFWVMEERAADYWHHFRRRAVELESELGYRQYTTRPVRNFISATNAVRLLYGVVVIFWLISLLLQGYF